MSTVAELYRKWTTEIWEDQKHDGNKHSIKKTGQIKGLILTNKKQNIQTNKQTNKQKNNEQKWRR